MLSFHHAEWNEPGDLAGETGVVTDFYDGVDVLVGVGFLLGEPPRGTAAHQDAGGLQVSAQRITAGAASGLMTALHSAGAMRGGRERGVIGDSAST
jgi:hypothetical protein